MYFKLKITCAVPHRIIFMLDKVEVSEDEVFHDVCQLFIILDFKVHNSDMFNLNKKLLILVY